MLKNPLEFFNRARSLGPLVRIQVGPTKAFLVNNHETLYDILIKTGKEFDKGVHFERAKPLLGNGILLSSGEFHKRQRRMMQPAFHHTMINSYVDVMRSSAVDIFDSWHDGQVVQMYDIFYELAVRIVIRTMFSTDMAEQDIADVYRYMPTVISGFEKRAAIPPVLVDLVPTRSSREFHTAVKELRTIGARIVADYRSRPEVTGTDLMSLLFTARDEGDQTMTDTQILEEFMTLLTAGSETTPSAMSWACYLLGQHPEIQEQVQAEIDEKVGGRDITASDIGGLDLTRRVVHESLRLYPPVWALSRRTAADVTLDGHEVAAKTLLFYSFYSIHRDGDVYSDPDEFQPERWKGEAGKKLPRTAFLPFGAGFRNCIGEAFAWAEIQCVLGTLLQRWTIQPVETDAVTPVAMGALVPGPLPMRLVRRAE
jgi:cytochrome P450